MQPVIIQPTLCPSTESKHPHHASQIIPVISCQPYIIEHNKGECLDTVFTMTYNKAPSVEEPLQEEKFLNSASWVKAGRPRKAENCCHWVGSKYK